MAFTEGDVPADARPADTPAGGSGEPAGSAEAPVVDGRVRKTIDRIVHAVRNGEDKEIDTLLADLAAVAGTTDLLNLRERLYRPL
ncbi:hypothetical protein [Streptomyces sp. A1136]|uniref:hypothetical protein n=1 Tax=Streptomyces sp. A1136 TaxID=2563102 RepID=UPI00109E9575|nr:hypothetical protein [Streptomyces sp. A1136]THA51639.1 hypothetical protein E6R62_22300 [Streptomyces sp. A1136]